MAALEAELGIEAPAFGASGSVFDSTVNTFDAVLMEPSSVNTFAAVVSCERVSVPLLAQVRRPEVGERVEIVGLEANGADWIGSRGTIEVLDQSPDYPYRVRLDSGESGWYSHVSLKLQVFQFPPAPPGLPAEREAGHRTRLGIGTASTEEEQREHRRHELADAATKSLEAEGHLSPLDRLILRRGEILENVHVHSDTLGGRFAKKPGVIDLTA